METVSRYSLHSSRVVGSYPLSSERATSRPHADMIIHNTLLYKYISLTEFYKRILNKGMLIIIPMGIYPLLCSLTTIRKVSYAFEESENKVRDKRLFHIWYPQCDFHRSGKSFPNYWCPVNNTLHTRSA